jgi:urea transport system permease protein
MAFPMGLAGVWEERILPWWRSRRQDLKDAGMLLPPFATTRLSDETPTLDVDVERPEGVRGQGF